MKTITLLLFSLLMAALSWQDISQMASGVQNGHSEPLPTHCYWEAPLAFLAGYSFPTVLKNNVSEISNFTLSNLNNPSAASAGTNGYMDYSNFYENLGRDHNGTYLSMERRAMLEGVEVYPLYSAGVSKTDYTLTMAIGGLDSIFLYVDDNFTGSSTLLEQSTVIYSFNIDSTNLESKALDRFSISIGERLNVGDNNLLSSIQLYPNPLDGNTFYISAPSLMGEQMVGSINDLTGRRIYEERLECQANTITVPMGDHVASGIYLVTLKLEGKVHTYKLIKK